MKLQPMNTPPKSATPEYWCLEEPRHAPIFSRSPEKTIVVRLVMKHLRTATAVLEAEINSKSIFEEFRRLLSVRHFQANLGRILELENQCYLQTTNVSLYMSSEPVWLNNPLLPKSWLLVQHSNPRDKFVPSARLVESIKKYILTPDADLRQAFINIGQLHSPDKIEEAGVPDIGGFISEQVEAFLSHLAEQAWATGRSVGLSDNQRFSREICRELVEWLEIDPYDPRPVLDLLYDELVTFVSATPRKRPWGEIFLEDSELRVGASEDPSIVPSLKNREEGTWITVVSRRT
jgi:hypothetical protein